MDTSVIHWKLNELMAKKRVRNKDLAQALGITENSVYRLRKTDEMPRLTPERLNGICTYLDCQPGELLVWSPDDSPQTNEDNKSSTKSSNKNMPSSKSKDIASNSSFLEVILDFPESA